jgi:chemosensory pili system protein ChpB (putative protein-glutamate methylesterase)
MSVLSIGIVSETLVQQHYLQHAIDEIDYSVGCSLLVANLAVAKTIEKMNASKIDAWIIDVDVERLDQEAVFQQWLYDLDAPIIFSEGHTYNAAGTDFISWTRQLKVKLLSLEGQSQLRSTHKVKASHIWVLAASTGGPEAVKQFLDIAPVDMDIAFIYAQHIGEGHSHALSTSIARNNQFECSVAIHGDVVTSGRVIIVPPEHQISIQKNGSIIAYPQKPWRGVYKPSVDQVVANVASNYGACSGVIFFTGMGNDGAKACRLMSLHKGQVWAQNVSGCVAPSMPQEVINTGCNSKIDTPENLARHLKTYLLNQ